jgi:hypothetical protein
MGDLKPLGSEKLTGMDKLKRIMEIATYNETPKNNINEVSSVDYKIELADGNTYAIVKEKNGYVLMKGLNESTMDYIEPMKGRKHYRAYSEAMKKLNLTAAELNRVYGHNENISLIGEQEGKKKRFVLKTNTKTPDVGSSEPAPPAPPVAEPAPPAPTTPEMESTPPSPEMGSPEAPEMGGDMGSPESPEMGSEMGSPEAPEMGGEMGSPEAPEMGNEDDFDMGEDDEQKGPSFKSIQRLTGKLSQRLRTIEKERNLESDDIKYVLNSILSALNLDNLEEDDKDDILSKFDGEEDEYDMGSDELDMGSESDLDISEPISDEEPKGTMSEPKEEYTQVMDSIFGESKVEKLLESYFVIKPSENKILEEKRKKDFLKKQMQNVKVKKEIRNLSETVEQMSQSLNIFESGAKFIGKTNKENLVFVKEGKQFKVTPHGRIL